MNSMTFPLIASFVSVAAGTAPICDAAEGCDDSTSLLALRGIQQKIATMETSMQCCYHDCGSCREPDEFCNTEALCESTDSQQGGCSGTCREPDEFCNTEALCEADQQGGCSGTWLQ